MYCQLWQYICEIWKCVVKMTIYIFGVDKIFSKMYSVIFMNFIRFYWIFENN